MISRRAVPLALTVLRFVLGPVFLAVYVSPRIPPGQTLLLFAIIVAAIFSDWLDGYAARRLNAVSAAGKLLDPFADALFCMLVFIAFARIGLMPVWIVAVLICREALVTFVLRPLALWRGVVIAARMWGKVKTSFQFGLMIVVLVAHLPDTGLATGPAFLKRLAVFLEPVGFYSVLGLSLISLGFYIFDVTVVLGKARGGEKAAVSKEEVSSSR